MRKDTPSHGKLALGRSFETGLSRLSVRGGHGADRDHATASYSHPPEIFAMFSLSSAKYEAREPGSKACCVGRGTLLPGPHPHRGETHKRTRSCSSQPHNSRPTAANTTGRAAQSKASESYPALRDGPKDVTEVCSPVSVPAMWHRHQPSGPKLHVALRHAYQP